MSLESLVWVRDFLSVIPAKSKVIMFSPKELYINRFHRLQKYLASVLNSYLIIFKQLKSALNTLQSHLVVSKVLGVRAHHRFCLELPPSVFDIPDIFPSSLQGAIMNRHPKRLGDVQSDSRGSKSCPKPRKATDLQEWRNFSTSWIFTGTHAVTQSDGHY